MQKTFTKEFMIVNSGCYNRAALHACSFMQRDEITLQSIIESEIPLKDKYWFVCKNLATKEQNKQIAIDIASIALPIYELCYPDDLRPRESIEAIKDFLVGHISPYDLEAKKRAANSASSDAANNAADAVTAYSVHIAAAYAAYAAYAATSNSYVSAYAVYIAAAYAADRTSCASIKNQLYEYLKKITQ